MITHFNLSPSVLPLVFYFFFCLTGWDEENQPHVSLFFIPVKRLFSAVCAQQDSVTFRWAATPLMLEHFFRLHSVYIWKQNLETHAALETNHSLGNISIKKTRQLSPHPASCASIDLCDTHFYNERKYWPQNESSLIFALFPSQHACFWKAAFLL